MFDFGASLKKVIAGISTTAGLDFIDPKLQVFESPDDAQAFTKIGALHALNDFKAPTLDSKKCLVGLTKILYLLNKVN
ncbi:hypothetical protein GNI_118470 [Gregarina niphandrodes]|uniref:Uncharacterized protein n=1 Tax=Gregarina niphandrodes TaxID=110365 RepID=A0A023B2R3_GRENI|nr:hypothetical protein GNI_118470 [Gregarina niphandrodes]EZG55087.1 hypothetical protein GNI_118470 [Gregarina niphandrodes]|eukprot:XP_011131790.1 hypothetical protein GNI_118470 [Gregarina niphandrodes]